MSPRRTLTLVLAAAAVLLAATPSAAVDRRAEATAKDALKKAANDFLSTDYDGAARRLEHALRMCGPSRCTPQTRAALHRDIGTMQFFNGDFGTARKSFAEAQRLQPDIKLNPDYDSAELQAAWRDAGAAGAATAGAGAQPTGDFTHTPAPAQKANTPLPIYVELPSSEIEVSRVVVKYRTGSMSDWGRLDLKKMGNGWGGQIPCGDVTVGTMRYWVQGFGAGGDPVVNSGDPKHPFLVGIKNEITTDAPHLPGKAPPRSCEESDCPPGLPGCGTKEEEPSEGGEPEAEKLPEDTDRYARIWVGASLAIDFIPTPKGDGLCILTAQAAPANSSHYYCTNPDGTNFPSRNPAGQSQNATLMAHPGEAGHSDGGLGIGNVRVVFAADYAFTPNVLAGIRFGYVFNAYTGTAAVQDGRAFGPDLHIEARATYVLGRQPLRRTGFAPMAFAGLGLSEFDWHTTSVVAYGNGQAPVNVWYTDAPFFLVVGGGVRYQFSARAAFTSALRLDLTIGGNGVLPTLAPEMGVLYGF